ncbi:hypothetical protein [Burkholderia glumae]|uniref:hypothetical protein n=1 Tax=Burkholderia glumae TaxID=337 RepID=UPI0012979D2C|nr:hypothetical protein [Burkholderia glumae]MCM2485557.1 hypothetical protein [Burkholderia glumae]MCM2493727.1 hypothetical protein [Burkholderia glumae]MCQ0034391.1 hypothetical protein [Burkholderia glumae]MCQ0039423.1 hypothetical protein [Burkholderia glumae]MCR1770913.1 hypothetical protein [Burkholderia glumae]
MSRHGNRRDHAPLETRLRSFKTEWQPSLSDMAARKAHRDISDYPVHRYNWIRPHQLNDGPVLDVTKEKLNSVSGMR